MKKIVIVGGVAAGASAAARLRRLDEEVEIVVLERGPYMSYANCGLPYYVGGVIEEREALFLQSPELFKERFNVEVKVNHNVTAIHKKKKTLSVINTETGEECEEAYDTLVLATGSSPIVPPIEGIDSDRVMTLWTVPDVDKIKAFIEAKQVKTAAVIGGGFIGLEMAENLHELGIGVTLIEKEEQVMKSLDREMANVLHDEIVSQGLGLILGDGVIRFRDKGSQVSLDLESGKSLDADMVILSIGVKPNSGLAKEAGLTLNQRAGIVVDGDFKTSDGSIYAVGDVIEVTDFMTGERTMVPLAGPANKQGRMLADNLMGAKKRFKGSQKTAIAKVFRLAAANVGLREADLLAQGKVKGQDFGTALISQNTHASYYPGGQPMFLKLVFDLKDQKVLGAQVVGYEGVDKRIDVLATLMRMGGTVEVLTELELAYAPPFSSAKDPVNMLGFVAENMLTGKMAFSPWDLSQSQALVLDVREEEEVMAYGVPGAKHIPLGDLRDRLGELDQDQEIIVLCAVGVRSYNGMRILANHGFKKVSIYPGGVRFYKAMQYHLDQKDHPTLGGDNMKGEAEPMADESKEIVSLNCTALQCPGPIMKVNEALAKMEEGGRLEVKVADPGFAKDIAAWCQRTGNTLLDVRPDPAGLVAYVRKGGKKTPLATNTNLKDGKTIVVFSGELDKVMAALVIANGARAMGGEVTLFFTFWGLNALRKSKAPKVKKSPVEKMFSSMMPQGVKKLPISNMNMFGLGSKMMKKVMKDKNVDSLAKLMKQAQASGVKFIACTMSMDVMGIKEEELIDGVELAGVASYLGDAENASVNLFV